MKPTKKFLETYHIQDYFSSLDFPMDVRRYKKGELLIQPSFPTENLIIILQGTIHIYSIQEDGSSSLLTIHEKCKVLGDIEFVNKQSSPAFVEAASEIVTLEIPMDYCQTYLKNDPKFLYFLLESIAEKMEKSSHQGTYINLEDKVLKYFQLECADGILRNVGSVANKLHISRRQFQRILKKLTEEERIEKLGKGIYRLV